MTNLQTKTPQGNENSIRQVLEELASDVESFEYITQDGINDYLKEIKTILDGAKPEKYNSSLNINVGNDTSKAFDRGFECGFNRAVNDYQSNIAKVIGL